MVRKISLTVDERVLLHLLEFIPYEEDFESPVGCTQAGIAKGVGIRRKHIPRAVKKLLEQQLLTEKVSHVKGSKQRKKVYFPSFEGRSLARKIWESLAKREIYLSHEDGKRSSTTFGDLCFTYQVERTPVEILLSLRDGNVYYPHIKDMFSEEEKSITIEDPEGLKDVYRKVLSKAWEDEILTTDEDAILVELRSSLGISKEEHISIQEEILEERKVDRGDMDRRIIFQRIYDVAMRDGKITGDEQAMLDELAVILGLDGREIEESIKDMGPGGMSKEEVKRLALRDVYSAVLREALRDGKISRDEQNIIIMLKKFLFIDEKEHLEIYDNIREGKDPDGR